MNEDYVSVELAKKLQKKGFPLREVTVQDGSPIFFDLPMDHPEWHQCDAWYIPTIAQVLKWLRKEKNLFVEVNISVTGWYYIIYEIAPRRAFDLKYMLTHKESYEAAAIAGIEDCSDNLI